MYFELKENRPHGTPENPFSQYHISDVKRAFQIPVHWHDELEIIYVKQGKLHVTISGENYIGSPKDTFVVSPGSLHFMGSPTGDADYYTFLFPLEYISFQTDMTQNTSVFENGDLKIDYAAGCAYLNGDELHLTPIEYKLLILLSRNVGRVLTYTYITKNIWGSSWENDLASLRVFMATLRKKIEKDVNSPQYIQTHIGIGYRMLRV
jgi:DNA-binding winged helix-turn-helix (wHTH) protein/quercetin dioxygenase-like cupin family protein